MDYSALHDASLQTVQLQWVGGVVRLSLIYSDGGCRRHGTICGSNVSEVRCSRAFPWGRSQSINTVTLDDRDTPARLLLEMQSGDQVAVMAGVVFFEKGEILP